MNPQQLTDPLTPEAPALTLGGRIRTARRARHLSQDQVAQPEFTRSYVSAVERDKARPSLKALRLMAARLGTTAAELLEEPTALPGGGGGWLTELTVLDTATAQLNGEDPAAAQGTLAAGPALEPTTWPLPLQVRWLALRGQILLGLGQAGTAQTLLGSHVARLPLSRATVAVHLTLAAASEPPYNLAGYAGCATVLDLEQSADLPLLLQWRALAVTAYARVGQHAPILALAEGLLPVLAAGLPLEQLAPGWPASHPPQRGPTGRGPRAWPWGRRLGPAIRPW